MEGFILGVILLVEIIYNGDRTLFKKALLVMSLCIPSVVTYAGGSDVGKVYRIEFDSVGKVLFLHTGERTNIPSCVGSSFTKRWAMDVTSDGGKAQLSGLLYAAASDSNITIVGAGDCSVHGDSETVRRFYTE